VFASSLYRGSGPPNTDMKDGNESGKDGWLVCTGIVRGIDTVKGKFLSIRLSQERLEWHSGSKMHLLPAQMESLLGRMFSLNLGQNKCKGLRLMIKGKGTQCTMSRRRMRKCNNERLVMGRSSTYQITRVCVNFFSFPVLQYEG
jgi:hypothetical protein